MPPPLASSPDRPPVVAVTGMALVARWAVGGLEIIGVGLLASLAVLLIGAPVALAIRLCVELARRL